MPRGCLAGARRASRLGYARAVTNSSTHRPSRRPAAADPSLVGLIAAGTLDAELAAMVWLLVEAGLPLVVAAPVGRFGAGAQLVRGVLGSVRGASEADAATADLDRMHAWQLVRGGRPGAVIAAASLAEVRAALAGPPFLLGPEELTFLGCVLVLGQRSEAVHGVPRPGPLRVTAAHYVRPLARDAHGHAQVLPPAVLATWDARLGRYEHFAWGVLPEIAARVGRKAGDLEADLHHRRDDLAGLVSAGLTDLAEVRRLIAGYRAGYGGPHHPERDSGPLH
jgi:hypothetical protein